MLNIFQLDEKSDNIIFETYVKELDLATFFASIYRAKTYVLIYWYQNIKNLILICLTLIIE